MTRSPGVRDPGFAQSPYRLEDFRAKGNVWQHKMLWFDKLTTLSLSKGSYGFQIALRPQGWGVE